MINKMLDDDDIKATLRAFFLEGEGPANYSKRIEMGPSDLGQNPALKHACESLGICKDTPHFSGEFNVGSSEEFKEFIKEKIREESIRVESDNEL